MKYLQGVFSLSLLAALLSFGTLPIALSAQEAVHLVAKGETVYSISRSYKVSPEELMKHNNITDPSKLQAGQRLRIPSGASAPSALSPAPSAGAEYRVLKNDTLFSIARKYGVTVQSLRDINQFAANHVLKEGERIKVPVSDKAAGKANGTVTAQSGTSQPALRPTTAKAVDASLRWPVAPKTIAYMNGKLNGVMLQGERSESVKSLTLGRVISVGPYRGFGRVAIVEVTGGYLYVYGGCESLSVKEGDRIGPGTELGKLGVDAVSEKPQLFFMVYRNGAPIDPAKAPRA